MEVILQIWQEVNVLLHLLLRISHFQLQKTAKRKLFEKSEIQYPEILQCVVGKLYATHSCLLLSYKMQKNDLIWWILLKYFYIILWKGLSNTLVIAFVTSNALLPHAAKIQYEDGFNWLPPDPRVRSDVKWKMAPIRPIIISVR